MTPVQALALLTAADVFYGADPDDSPEMQAEMAQTLNLNDILYPASDAEMVPDSELVTVASLFLDYGWCGLCYWVSERRGGGRAFFADAQAKIEFVRSCEQSRLARLATLP